MRGLFAPQDVRLVTLTGVGGVRLALEIADVLEPGFRDGAWWVELAGVARSEDVASTVLRALAAPLTPGESADDTLRRFLAGKQLLLAIDNFEHVPGASQLIGELHGARPGLRMLITGREALDIACKHRVVVAPLSVRSLSGAVGVAEIESTDATARFVAAARRRDSRFSVTPEIAPVIARICGRLDGLPLALELAAARTGALSVAELAERLDHTAWELGSGGRDAQRVSARCVQRSSGATACSTATSSARSPASPYSPAERRSKRPRRSRARSPPTIEMLIAKSLLDRRRAVDGRTRLVMLETIRAYASERLVEDNEYVAVLKVHNKYYLGLGERASPRRTTDDNTAALATIDDEINNVLQTLELAAKEAPTDALRLAPVTQSILVQSRGPRRVAVARPGT